METTIIKHNGIQLTDKAKEWMVYGVCLLCIALFTSAAYSKIADHETFLKGLLNVSLIGGVAIYIAWLVPLAEILISVLLIVPKTHRWGLYGFVGLMVIFTAYIASMLFWAEKLPCHCNLIIEKLGWGAHLWFNMAFIAVAVFALWMGKVKHKH